MLIVYFVGRQSGIQQPADHSQPRFQPVLPEPAVGKRHAHAVFAESGRVDVQPVQHLPGGRAGIPVAFELYDDKSFQRAPAPGGHVVEA